MAEAGKSVLVTVTDAMLPEIAQVAVNVQAQGMQISQVLTSVGVISGTCPEALLRAVADVPGVRNVEPDTLVQLPPVDSPVQ